MNIKFAFIVFLLLTGLAFSVTAQESQSKSPAAGGIGPANGPASPYAPGVSKLPDEQSLLIPSGQPNAGALSKPVKTFGVWDFVQMILILALVVGGIYLLFYFLKKAGGKKLPDNDLIDVLSSRTLQQNRSLHLVEVGRQLFLVGSAEGGVSLVAEIHDKETVDEIRIRASEKGSLLGRRNFRDIFSGMFNRGGGMQFGASLAESMGFMKRQRERLKKL